jgi:tRNA threonylcarbamoyladenosine biosynthesis protein TsaE
MTKKLNSKSLNNTLAIAARVGRKLTGGEVIELVSDLGGGKTVFVRGLAQGIASRDVVQSPSFTIARVYCGHNDLELHHFDFYRLEDAGVVADALAEVLKNPKAIVALEWGGVVQDVLPGERLQVSIKAVGEEERELTFKATDKKHQALIRDLQ